MDTETKPISGIEFVRHLISVKEQAQSDAVENYRNDPELRSVINELKKIIGKREVE